VKLLLNCSIINFSAMLRIRDVYPGYWILIFPLRDPATTERRGENNSDVVPVFVCSHKFHRIENYLYRKRFESVHIEFKYF
jgi:hypothetical protein